MVLERELETYKSHLIDLLQHEGKYIVIKGTEVLPGAWETYNEASEKAYEHFGHGPFLIKNVQAVEPIRYFARDLPR